MNQLAGILGAFSYLREGPVGIFQKLMRDLQAISVVHLSRAAARMSLLPQFPLLAKRAWNSAEPASESLFTADAELPPLDFEKLRVTGNGRDHLASTLVAGVASLSGDDPEVRLIRDVAEKLVADLAAIREECLALTATEVGVAATPRAARLVDRYVDVLIGSACFETWRHQKDEAPWRNAALVAVLIRLSPVTVNRPAWVEDRLFAELVGRCQSQRSLGLAGHQLFDH
jgi:hypothetical protein